MAVAIWYGCKSEEETLSGSIYGVVTDKATGEPISAAGVELSPLGYHTVTGTEGQFEFRELTPGSYTLLVTKTGYLDYLSRAIEVAPSQAAKGDVQIEKLPAALKIVDDKGQDINCINFGSEESVTTRTFSIFNDSPERLEWIIMENCEWIVSVSKSSGILQPGKQQPISIVIDRNKMLEGENIYVLNITSDNGSKELTIKAMGSICPVIYMLSVTNISYAEATFVSKVLNVGSPIYEECGFVVSKESVPTVDNALLKKSMLNSNKEQYEFWAEDLSPRTEYIVRAYIRNAKGIFYSANEIKFSTLIPQLPVVLTQSPIKIYETGAVLNGYISSVGRPSFLSKGFVCSTTKTNPELDDKESEEWIISSNATGKFELSVTGMKENLEYYIRAFAITPYDTVYGQSVAMITQQPYKTVENLGVRLEDEYIVGYDLEYQYIMTIGNAKNICEDLIIGRYDDWRVPTIDELKKMYENRTYIGKFSQDVYWSSTKNKEYPDFETGESAWDEGYVGLDFSNGKIKYSNPYASSRYRVRGVRTLP